MQIMYKFMEDLKHVVEKLVKKKEFDKAIDLLSEELKKEPDHPQLLELRGDVYYTQEKFGNALNDFNKILKLDDKNTKVLSKAVMTKQILRFQNLDIYETTNLNLDPWLDD